MLEKIMKTTKTQNHNQIDKDLVSDVLKYIENRGWTELIDRRWGGEVSDIIKIKFPNINIETLNYILELILI